MNNSTNWNQSFDDNATCVTIQEAFPDFADRLEIQIFFGFLYTVIWILGVTGNLLVIYVTGYKRLSFTVRTVFILSLACSDLFIACTCLPMTAILIFSRNFIFPPFFCYPISFIQGLAVIVSSFTLVAIAIDRYFLIIHPTKDIINYSRAKAMVFLIWVLGTITALPLLLYTKVVTYDGYCGYFCMVN